MLTRFRHVRCGLCYNGEYACEHCSRAHNDMVHTSIVFGIPYEHVLSVHVACMLKFCGYFVVQNGICFGSAINSSRRFEFVLRRDSVSK